MWLLLFASFGILPVVGITLGWDPLVKNSQGFLEFLLIFIWYPSLGNHLLRKIDITPTKNSLGFLGAAATFYLMPNFGKSPIEKNWQAWKNSKWERILVLASLLSLVANVATAMRAWSNNATRRFGSTMMWTTMAPLLKEDFLALWWLIGCGYLTCW